MDYFPAHGATNMTTAIDTDKRRQLLQEGFCLFEQILDCELLEQTREISDALLDGQPPEHFEQQKSTGSMVSLYDDPGFAGLVRCPAAVDTWPEEARSRIAHLLPEYDGVTEPIAWNRIPGPALRDILPGHSQPEPGNRKETLVT